MNNLCQYLNDVTLKVTLSYSTGQLSPKAVYIGGGKNNIVMHHSANSFHTKLFHEWMNGWPHGSGRFMLGWWRKRGHRFSKLVLFENLASWIARLRKFMITFCQLVVLWQIEKPQCDLWWLAREKQVHLGLSLYHCYLSHFHLHRLSVENICAAGLDLWLLKMHTFSSFHGDGWSEASLGRVHGCVWGAY